MKTELDLENAGMLQDFCKGDVTSFNDLLCTAWGLLLRCYTGQDNVSFHFGQGSVNDLVSKSAVLRGHWITFRMTLHEQESLSTCVARAKDGYADNEHEGPSLVSTAPDSRTSSVSYHRNTHVWVQDATCKDMQDVAVQKVFEPISPNASLETRI